jgi:hypothetical protein
VETPNWAWPVRAFGDLRGIRKVVEDTGFPEGGTERAPDSSVDRKRIDMNPCNRFFPGPYTPPACIPWPKNEHEAHVIVVMQLLAWTLALLLMWWRTWQLEQQARAEEQRAAVPKNQPQTNPERIPFFPQGVYGAQEASQGSALRSDRWRGAHKPRGLD